VGADCAAPVEDGFLFRFPAGRAAAIRYDPPAGEAVRKAPRVPVSARELVVARPTAALLSSIAMNLSDAEQVTALIASQRQSRPDLNVPYVAPTTDIEKRLAAMFEELLGVERVGILDDFFSLGGHSLLAMMLINRLRNAFQVELPITVLFDQAFTVATMAQTVTRFQRSAGSESTPDALKHLLETLSDDEVRALLPERSPISGKSGPEKA
jgi:acyl carrier protein